MYKTVVFGGCDILRLQVQNTRPTVLIKEDGKSANPLVQREIALSPQGDLVLTCKEPLAGSESSALRAVLSALDVPTMDSSRSNSTAQHPAQNINLNPQVTRPRRYEVDSGLTPADSLCSAPRPSPRIFWAAVTFMHDDDNTDDDADDDASPGISLAAMTLMMARRMLVWTSSDFFFSTSLGRLSTADSRSLAPLRTPPPPPS
jgi:hypothetical protein